MVAPSATTAASPGSTIGSATAPRNAAVAAAIQAAMTPRVASAATSRPQRQRGQRGERGQHERDDAGADPAELGERVAADQVVDRGRVDIDARDGVAPERLAFGRRAQGAARRARALRRGGKALRGDLAVLDVEHGADQHDLAGEMFAEEAVVVLCGAGGEVGEGVGRDVACAAFEVEHDRVRHRAAPHRGRRGHWPVARAPPAPPPSTAPARRPPRSVSGTRRITSSGSECTFSARMLRPWPTAARWPDDGSTGLC